MPTGIPFFSIYYENELLDTSPIKCGSNTEDSAFTIVYGCLNLSRQKTAIHKINTKEKREILR